MKRRMTALTLLALLCITLTGCSREEPQSVGPKSNAYFTWFDTVSYIYSYAEDTAETFELHSAGVSDILSEYHQLFDIYHEYSGINNLCTVNRLAGGEAVTVDPKLIDFLLYARELYDLTGGEMNILLGPVLKIWHDHRTSASEDPSAATLPDEEALRAAAAFTDFSHLEIDEEHCTVRLNDPNAAIDVGALGKGYATEKAAEYLIEEKAYGYVLNVGGNIRVIGTKPDGSGWKTAVKDPKAPDTGYSAVMDLTDTACVTSGNYERFFTVAGKQYHHIIDPDTLWPSEHFASVTVVTENSGLADALSTALLCMSYEEGLALVQGIEGVDALWIDHDGTLRYTQTMSERMVNG